jgi:hypothetical protein
MDRPAYIGEADRQLSDSATYQPISSLATIPIQQIFDSLKSLFLVAKERNLISAKVFQYLTHKITPTSASLPRFYHFPKIHKKPLKGRPIVPSHKWITTPASVWIDHMLQPFVQAIPTLTKDSTSLINALEQLRIVQTNCILITMDVISLYTNIPTPTGIAFVKRFLKERTTLNQELQTLIIEVLKIVLTNNYFSFNNHFFLQLVGTAMGTPAAVVYANIFMFAVEETVLLQHSASILFYTRFLDDIFCIITTDADADAFINALQLRHPKIKMEVTKSTHSVNFLDLHIFKGPRFAATGILDTAVHQKQLNAYLYIPYRSFHPLRSKGGFIVTELMRYVRNCSSRSDYLTIKHMFYQRLRARGYPITYLRFLFSKVSYQDRPKLLHPTSKQDSTPTVDCVFFTTTYDGLTHKLPLSRILHLYLTGGIPLKPRVGFRRSRNLHNLLCNDNHATPGESLDQLIDPPPGLINPNNPQAR